MGGDIVVATVVGLGRHQRLLLGLAGPDCGVIWQHARGAPPTDTPAHLPFCRRSPLAGQPRYCPLLAALKLDNPDS